MDARHIGFGALGQGRDTEMKDNIWWQEALKFVSFLNNSDVYKTGYCNDTIERILKS